MQHLSPSLPPLSILDHWRLSDHCLLSPGMRLWTVALDYFWDMPWKNIPENCKEAHIQICQAVLLLTDIPAHNLGSLLPLYYLLQEAKNLLREFHANKLNNVRLCGISNAAVLSILLEIVLVQGMMLMLSLNQTQYL